MRAGWQTKTLGEVCEFQRGLTYAKGDEVDVSDNIILRATNIDLATNLLDFSELKYISDGIAIPENKKVKAGSLMICTASGSKSHLGKVAYIDDDYGYAFGGFMGMVTPKHELHPKFLFHLMTSPYYKDFIAALSDGANINNLKFDDLRKFVVPLPPLSEQQRIIGILDEAFDGIATAKANAEQNLQNARALFESHLQSVFTQRGEGWEEKQLGEIAEVQSGGTPSVSQKKYWGGDIPWYSSGELNETYTTHPERKITGDGLNSSNAKLFPKGSLLVGMYDTAALKMSILDRDGAFNQAIAGVKPNDRIEVEFILHAINANKPRLLLERRGTRQKNLSLGKIKEISIPLPEPSEQRAVVSRIRSVMAETQRLESLYQRKLAALDELKKSLLHQAFSGAL
jgi:type I restriction enzyme S subunit